MVRKGRLITARHKFNGVGNPMSLGTGFPDFIAYKLVMLGDSGIASYEVIGVEAKSNGYLSKEEKLKCDWLLNNNIFSKILIAKKGEKRGVIEYKEIGGKCQDTGMLI